MSTNSKQNLADLIDEVRSKVSRLKTMTDNLNDAEIKGKVATVHGLVELASSLYKAKRWAECERALRMAAQAEAE